MPEENDAENGGKQEEKKTEFKAPASQEEFDRMVGARLERERSKFADYDDLKAKAEKFDKSEEANKTELQKAQDAAKAAEERATKAERNALVASVAADKGVPASALTGSTKEELEKSADELLEWRGEKPAAKKPESKRLKSGSSGSSEDDGLDGKDKAAALLRQYRAASH